VSAGDELQVFGSRKLARGEAAAVLLPRRAGHSLAHARCLRLDRQPGGTRVLLIPRRVTFFFFSGSFRANGVCQTDARVVVGDPAVGRVERVWRTVPNR
jgi:hypothetical protein